MGNKNVVYLTQEGLDELKKELDELINIKRPENVQAIKEARALGDLSENAEYTAAKAKQRELEYRLGEIDDIIKHHEIIAEEWCTIRYDELGIEKDIMLVGVLEADPEAKKISRESPLGKAISGRKIGETVTFTTGTGKKMVVTLISKGKIK